MRPQHMHRRPYLGRITQRPLASAAALAVRLKAREDRGIALVTVIGAMLVMGIVVTIVLSATSSTVRTTTVTRSDVQSKAAAEAGVAYAQSVITGEEECSAPGGSITSPAGLPTFDAEIFWSAGETATELSTPGCPGEGATSVLIRSTGTADAAGIGDSRNNTNTVEALLSAPPSGAPMFNAAIFANEINLNETARVVGEGADVVSYKSSGHGFACKNESPGIAIEGSVYSLSPVLLDTTCHIKGDVYGDQKLETSGASIQVDGNLYLQSDANFSSTTVKVGKDVWIGGNTNTNTTLNIVKTMKVRGDYNGSSRNHAIGGGLFYGGVADNIGATFAHAKDTSIGLPPTAASMIGTPSFPQLRHDNVIWKGWKKKTRQDVNWNKCDANDDARGTLTISENTVIDSTTDNCDWFNPRAKIILNADLVILAKNFQFQGDGPTIVSGDTGKHSIYFVTPVNPFWQNPEPDTHEGTINFRPTSWSQDSQISMLLYGSGQVDLAPSGTVAEMYGQAYAQKKLDLTTGVTLHYNPVSATDTSGGGLDSLGLLYQRDVS